MRQAAFSHLLNGLILIPILHDNTVDCTQYSGAVDPMLAVYKNRRSVTVCCDLYLRLLNILWLYIIYRYRIQLFFMTFLITIASYYATSEESRLEDKRSYEGKLYYNEALVAWVFSYIPIRCFTGAL